jgi:pectate lyase
MHITMALKGITNIAFLWRFALALVTVTLFTPDADLAKRPTKMSVGWNMNVIDRCRRWNPNWRSNRQQLATCSVGFAGKMTNNIGRGICCGHGCVEQKWVCVLF